MMRFLLFFASFFLFRSDEQVFIVDKKVELKPGFYRNFEEFKTNTPSIPFDNYPLTNVSKGYGFLNIAGEVIYYRIKMDKSLAKTIGHVYGFCDGNNIYLNTDDHVFKPSSDFVKLDYLGRYCYFEDGGFKTVYSGNGMPSNSTYLDKKALDINSGKIFSLNKKSLKEIMANDSELLEQFVNESSKNKMLKTYLISYSDKHSEEINR
ncbi:MAG: hypothetical protein M3Q05_11415 [Bacteroidota bacterium]|nr:hypothetical protein [Bacteroidota bacterium]